MLMGSNEDEVRYWINEMKYYSSFFSGFFLFKHGFPIMYENNLKLMSEEDKKNVDKFIDLKNDKKIWRLTEFYNEIVFRVPMIKQAEFHSQFGSGSTYIYHWKYPGADEKVGACHTIELPSVLNNLQETLLTGGHVNKDLANEVQNMWINFARNGNPSTEHHVWEPYDSATRKVMILDETIEMNEKFKEEQRELIEPLLKYYFNGCYVQLSWNVPQVYKIIAQVLATLLIIALFIALLIYFIVKFVKRRRNNRHYLLATA